MLEIFLDKRELVVTCVKGETVFINCALLKFSPNVQYVSGIVVSLRMPCGEIMVFSISVMGGGGGGLMGCWCHYLNSASTDAVNVVTHKDFLIP